MLYTNGNFGILFDKSLPIMLYTNGNFGIKTYRAWHIILSHYWPYGHTELSLYSLKWTICLISYYAFSRCAESTLTWSPGLMTKVRTNELPYFWIRRKHVCKPPVVSDGEVSNHLNCFLFRCWMIFRLVWSFWSSCTTDLRACQEKFNRGWCIRAFEKILYPRMS